MSKTVLEVLAEKHNDWITMATSFGLNEEDTKDIVQDMYICVDKAVDDVERIMYKDKGVNTFYVYTTLKNLHWQGYYRGGSSKKTPDIKCFSELKYNDNDGMPNEFDEYIKKNNETHHECMEEELFNSVSLNDIREGVDSIKKEWHWYDRDIFDLHFNKGISMRKLAKGTTISLSSIFNTIDNGRNKIRKELKDQWDLYNQK